MSAIGSKLGSYAPLIIAAVLVIVAFYAFSQSGGQSQGYTVIPGTDDSAALASVAETNAQLSANYNTGIFTAFGQLASLAGTEDSNATALAAQESTNAAQVTTTLAQQQAALQAAQIQANVLTTQYNDALSAAQAQAHAEQQNGLWSSIASIFGGVASIFTGGLFGGGGGGSSYTPSTSQLAPIGLSYTPVATSPTGYLLNAA